MDRSKNQPLEICQRSSLLDPDPDTFDLFDSPISAKKESIIKISRSEQTECNQVMIGEVASLREILLLGLELFFPVSGNFIVLIVLTAYELQPAIGQPTATVTVLWFQVVLISHAVAVYKSQL